MGLALVAELIRAEGHIDEVEIGANSQAALWETTNTRGMLGQHLLDKYQGQLEAAQQRHGADTITIRWTPGHDSIPGNKRADEEVKKAAYRDSSPAPLLPRHAGTQSWSVGQRSA